jgi:pimeloyl-ACP methyl ester carboxylesterase
MSSRRQHQVRHTIAGYVALLIGLGGSWSDLDAHERPELSRDRRLRALVSLSSTDTTPSTQEGLFDVGGHKLYLKCEGRGSPTVVYLHGLSETPAGGGSQNAGLVPSLLRDHVQVCVYDRANVGHSGSLPGPLTGKASVADLHHLLAAAHKPGPYVLVGGSFGGLIAIMYAATHPEDVVGMVLLDASLPDDVIKIDNRFLPRDARYRPDDWKRNTEQIDRGATYRQARAMQGRVPNIPLTYIASSRIKLDPSWPVEQMKAAIRAEQDAFVNRFPRGRLIRLDVPHFMEPAIPDTIADEIRRVIATTKRN